MIDPAAYKRLQATIEAKQTAIDRAIGAREQSLNRILDEFQCETLLQADELADQLEKEAHDHETRYYAAVKLFEAKFPDIKLA